MSLSIQLSIKNFSEASETNGNDEFFFSVGNQKVFCHKFVAAFLSHSISQTLISDPTTNSFDVNIQTPLNENSQNIEQIKSTIINILQTLIKGHSIEITNEDIQKFKEDLSNISQSAKNINISSQKIFSLLLLNRNLKNDEIKQQLYSRLFSIISTNSEAIEKEEIENQIKALHQIENFLNFFNENLNSNNEESMIYYIENYLHQQYTKFIDDVASHFFELDESTIINLNDFILNAILSSSKLKVESEDSLLNVLLKRRSFILEKEKKRENGTFFIEFIQFEFLSEKAIESFLNEIPFDEINSEIWERIKKRLVLPVQIKTKNERANKNTNVTLSYDEKNPLNGIFHHLTKITNGNIQKNNTVEITCSAICCGKLEEIVEYGNSKGWIHVNGNPCPRWLKIDFKSRKIKVNSYVIKIYEANQANGKFIRSWKLEISDDGNKWEMIDKRDDVSELNGYDKMKVFNISTEHQPFRFIRIITDKDNWCNNDGFELGRLELFGDIIE